MRGGQDVVELRVNTHSFRCGGGEPQVVAGQVLDEFGGGGLASLHEVASAIERFKASGKQVVAWGSNYDQRSYYLAAHANEVLLHPMGVAMLEGFGRYRNYYKDALDRAR